MLTYFLAGLISWPIFEYILHRWSGHILKWNNAFRKEHLTHHAVKDYFAPVWKKLAAALVVLPVLTLILFFFFRLSHAFIFSSGFLSMYLIYEFIHWRIHMKPPLNSYGRWIRHHHFTHHHINAQKNFSVTFPLIDYLFGTKLNVRPEVLASAIKRRQSI